MVSWLAPDLSHGNMGGTQFSRRPGSNQRRSAMSLLQLVRGDSSTGMPTREADINHVVSSHSWVHWHSRPRWLRLLPSIPQLEVSCKAHKTTAHRLSDNAHRSIPLGRLPFANVKASRGIVVHWLDLCRRADSPHRISCLCCWSSNGGHGQSQPS